MSLVINSTSQDTSREGQHKHVWSDLEDLKLIEAMLNLHNMERFTMDGGFKPVFFGAMKILVVTFCSWKKGGAKYKVKSEDPKDELC